MSTPIRNLWPDDLALEEIVSPEEILNYQADLLKQKTNGRLMAHVERLASNDRVVLSFEVESPLIGSRTRLFEVQHRLEFEYPARVFPPEALPEFLRDRVYQRDFLDGPASLGVVTGKWIERDGIASSPSEFSDQVEEILDSAAVKALMLSLLSRRKRDDKSMEDKSNGS